MSSTGQHQLEQATARLAERVTGESITDEQIAAMHWRGEIDCFTRDMAIVPYHESCGSPPEWREQARARCAEILNQRAGGSK